MGSLKKRISIHKSVNALIDVSAYNVTNSIIFGAPPVNTGTPSTFGTVTRQANHSRDIQLAFRLNFWQEFYRRTVSLWRASVAFYRCRRSFWRHKNDGMECRHYAFSMLVRLTFSWSGCVLEEMSSRR